MCTGAGGALVGIDDDHDRRSDEYWRRDRRGEEYGSQSIGVSIGRRGAVRALLSASSNGGNGDGRVILDGPGAFEMDGYFSFADARRPNEKNPAHQPSPRIVPVVGVQRFVFVPLWRV